jgi:transcription initiation factor TFIID TATA-box-binding protein
MVSRPDKPDISVTIQNIVASVTTGETINLQDVLKAFPEAEYRPKIFPGLCLRLKKPKTATLIFNSGRMVCTGAKSVKEVEKAVNKVLRGLKQEGIITNAKPEIEVQNIVASAILGGEIDLEKAAYSLGRTMYEPEQFPGAIYRMIEPKVVILIFAQGKLVITGAKKEEEPFQAAKGLRNTLEENELIYYGG